MAGSSRMEGARWWGGVTGRWIDGWDISFGVVDGCDRVASAFACFAFETASARGAGVGEAWSCVMTPGTLSDASSLEYTEDVLLLARDPRSLDRLLASGLVFCAAAMASNFCAWARAREPLLLFSLGVVRFSLGDVDRSPADDRDFAFSGVLPFASISVGGG